MQRTMGIHECGCLWPARGKKRRSFGQAKSEGLHEEFGSDTKKIKRSRVFSVEE